jgi:hypothetical protein
MTSDANHNDRSTTNSQADARSVLRELPFLRDGARSGAVGKGTMIQAGWSLVQFPVR